MKKFLGVICSIAILTGCAYQSQRDILKENIVGNSKTFAGSKQAVYNAFLKTALLKNFIIKEENEQAGSIYAERAVEKGKRTYILALQTRIFEESSGKSSMFINGSERCERTFIRDNTRFFLFIIPLPGGGGKEATSVVESVKALRDDRFYDDFFNMIQMNIIETEPDLVETEVSNLNSKPNAGEPESLPVAVQESEEEKSESGGSQNTSPDRMEQEV